MKRLTAYVSGAVQKVGYRARVIQMANAFNLKGIVENLGDGRVKIIVEGDEDKLRWFEEAIDIKNALIRVSAIEKEYSQAVGEFSSFSKVVGQGETDSRLDQGIALLGEILVIMKDTNANMKEMGSDMKQMSSDMKQMSSDMKQMSSDISEIKGDLKVVKANTALIPQIAENTKPIPQILEEINNVKEEIQPGIAVQLKQVQEDIRAIKERLGMP